MLVYYTSARELLGLPVCLGAEEIPSIYFTVVVHELVLYKASLKGVKILLQERSPLTWNPLDLVEFDS